MIAPLVVALTSALVLRYGAPLEEGHPAPAEFVVSEWEPGTDLWAARDGVPVREQPDPRAQTLATLHMAEPVRLTGRAPGRAELDGRVDRFYRVAAGWIFGGDLTPFAFREDLDGDGRSEVVVVAFGADFRIHVRGRGPSGDIADVALDPAGAALLGRRGGEVSVRYLPASEAGLALLRLDSQPEACSDAWSVWLSYRVLPRGGGQLREALRLQALVDPPVSSTYELTFDARRRRAVETRVQVETDRRGGVHRATRRNVYRLRDGVFVRRG